jgi:hypothetical protein
VNFKFCNRENDKLQPFLIKSYSYSYSKQTELRSAVVSSLASNNSENIDIRYTLSDAEQQQHLIETRRLEEIFSDKNTRIALALISDFCDSLGLNATKNVLIHETGLTSNEVTYMSQSELSAIVGESQKTSTYSNSSSSILIRLVSSVSNDVVIGGKDAINGNISTNMPISKAMGSKEGFSSATSSSISKVLGLGSTVNRLVLSSLDTSSSEDKIVDSLSLSGIKSPNALSEAEDRSPISSSQITSSIIRGGRTFSTQSVIPSLTETVRPSSSRGKLGQTGGRMPLAISSIPETVRTQRASSIEEGERDEDSFGSEVDLSGEDRSR